MKVINSCVAVSLLLIAIAATQATAAGGNGQQSLVGKWHMTSVNPQSMDNSKEFTSEGTETDTTTGPNVTEVDSGTYVTEGNKLTETMTSFTVSPTKRKPTTFSGKWPALVSTYTCDGKTLVLTRPNGKTTRTITFTKVP